MPIGVFIQLNPIGSLVGPTLDLFTNVDNYTTPFATGVTVSTLANGYWFSGVPVNAEIIKIMSTGDCTNHIFLNISNLPGCDDNYCLEECCAFILENNSSGLRSWSYYDCEGTPVSGIYSSGDTVSFCADQSIGPILVDSGCTLTRIGCCYECDCYTLINDNVPFTVEYTDCYGVVQTQGGVFNGYQYVVNYCGGTPTVVYGSYDSMYNSGDCFWDGIGYSCPP